VRRFALRPMGPAGAAILFRLDPQER